MSVTYDQALALFRNMVNQKHPPQMNATHNRTRRNINEVTTGRGRSSGRGGHGRGGRGGRHGGRGGRGTKTRTDSRMITLTDGTQIEYHASFNFPRHVYLKMKQEDRDTLKRERAAYNERNGRSSRTTEIQELRSQIQELQSVTGTQQPPTDTVSVSNRSHVSQMTTNHSIMGGRNEQANNRRAAAVVTKRHVKASIAASTSERPWSDPPQKTRMLTMNSTPMQTPAV
ncbi:hypothetical protein MHU86_2697 [Fragilaria crotonensis]|nr:hypothetical protein MHU86_2697 [Fragilaria crotonensis]